MAGTRTPAASHGLNLLNKHMCAKFSHFINLYVMSKRSTSLEAMPSAVLAQLRQLGEHLAIARKRRREPRKSWALRIGVSEPTLGRMERGDPSVAMGVYATALWLMGRSQALPELAAPVHDLGALEDAVRVAQKRSVRKRASLYGAAALGEAPTPGAPSAAPTAPAAPPSEATP
jgi:hypothetical protein